MRPEFLASCLSLLILRPVVAGEPDTAAAAQAYGKARAAVLPLADGTIVAEAEEFQATSPGWRAGTWGENYYAATLANTFLSRKAFLGAPERGPESVAAINVSVRDPGKYLVLVRYEAAYRFETQFRVRVEQAGRVALDRLYGARDNVKIWAFGQKLAKEVGWDWGAVENIVWEGHDAVADLQPGVATIRLIAADQPPPQARRNVDLVMLTTDHAQVQMRIDKENYLPLDGMLTQEGDVYLKVHNLGGSKLTVREGQFIAGPCQQHSPYWVHLRDWKPLAIEVEPGRSSDWVEVGRLLDSLNDGQCGFRAEGASPHYKLEFGVRSPAGAIEPIREFEGRTPAIDFAFHADTRYSRLIRDPRELLAELLAYLKAQPAHGRTPERTLIYGYTFDRRADDQYNRMRQEFIDLFGLAATDAESPSRPSGPRGYIDVRGVTDQNLDEYCAKLGDKANQIACVSLGDEIGLPTPTGDVQEDFHGFLRSRGLKPDDVLPGAGDDWNRIAFHTDQTTRATQPGVYYWSMRYLYDYGIRTIKRRTDVLRRHLPNAGIGANFSPHHGGAEHAYLGEVFKWVTCFRDEGMTMPWSEDYIWQVPVGTQQMNNISLDLFRAGLRGKPDKIVAGNSERGGGVSPPAFKIHFYVMPHWPGNTPAMWRRLFFGALGHGMKIVNLFEFRPVQAAYTENHVTHDPMYATVLGSFRELGQFEDVVQDGQVRAAEAGLWFSETGDIWHDNAGSFAAAKRSLYTAIRHNQIPLDFVVEQDALDGTLASYRVLYLTDNHVSRAASQRIAEWVERGGVLFATAGAGMWDELNQPNAILRKLLGVDQTSLDAAPSPVRYIKQDLPFAEPLDTVTFPLRLGALPTLLGEGQVDGVRFPRPLGEGQGEGSAAVRPGAPPPPPSPQPSPTGPKGRGGSEPPARRHEAVAADAAMPIFGVRSRIQLAGAQVRATFADGSPAVTTHSVGQGRAIYAAFLPGLSYYKPAIPLRPVDRTSAADAMCHFIPTQFDPAASALIAFPAAAVSRPVTCSEPLVETTIVDSPHGLAIPLVNWSAAPVRNLTVSVNVPIPAGSAALASGAALQLTRENNRTVFTVDLDIADVLVLR